MDEGRALLRAMLPIVLPEVVWRARHSWPGVPFDLIEDAVQDALVVVLAIPDPPPTQPRLRAFLLVVARRGVGTALKRRRSERIHRGERASADPMGNTEAEYLRVLAREIVLAIRKSPLTFRTRGVVERTFSGDTILEISIALKLKRDNVRQKLRRGRAWVQQHLGEWGDHVKVGEMTDGPHGH